MKTYEVTAWGKTYEVYPVKASYEANRRLAVLLMTTDGEVFCDVTKNIDDFGKIEDIGNDIGDWKVESKKLAYVNVNDTPWMPDFLFRNGLAVDTGEKVRSGFVVAPLFYFFTDKIEVEYA